MDIRVQLGNSIQQRIARMIFRREPLIDANWLLGPPDPQPAKPSLLKTWAWTAATAAAIVGSWYVYSDFSLRNRSLQSAALSNSPASAEPATSPSLGNPTTQIAEATPPKSAALDETRIRTVDRFVPDSFAKQEAGNAATRDRLTKVGQARAISDLPIDLNQVVAKTESSIAIPVRDLRADASPSLPYQLLQPTTESSTQDNLPVRLAENNDLRSKPTQASPAIPRQSNAEREPSVKLVRTVSYKGQLNSTTKPSNDREPKRTTTNQLRETTAQLHEADSPEVPPSTMDSAELSHPSESLQGLENRPTGEVIRLLGSIQPRLSGAAMHELRRRKMSDRHIELALALVSGPTEQRIVALEKLVSEENIAPMPWLVWMAEDQDRKVREHSIRLLASIANDDSRHHMRLLMNREKDESLRSLLRQLCIASGTMLGNK